MVVLIVGGYFVFCETNKLHATSISRTATITATEWMEEEFVNPVT